MEIATKARALKSLFEKLQTLAIEHECVFMVKVQPQTPILVHYRPIKVSRG